MVNIIGVLKLEIIQSIRSWFKRMRHTNHIDYKSARHIDYKSDISTNPPLSLIHHVIEGSNALAWDNDDCWDITNNNRDTHYWRLKPIQDVTDRALP